MPHILISAAHKSSGKTTVSIGLGAALGQRGVSVQSFKKGPDYIDPMWLSLATGRPCYNLDFHTMTRAEISGMFAAKLAGAQFGLIEANKGLYDGLDLDGSNSNAALAVLLQAPVVLVLDARGMTRGIAPLILGYQAFDSEVNIAGVILNRLGGRRHESKLRAVIEHYTDLPVLGAVLNDPELEIKERHLGLIPSNEQSGAIDQIARVGARIGEQVDLTGILAVAATASPPRSDADTAAGTASRAGLRIAVLRDSAFGFYYASDLEALQKTGVQLLYVNAMQDAQLPDVHGVFIGGGFPETHLAALEANSALRADIRSKIEAGLPVYAECGGLMYLCREIRWRGERRSMVGALPADVVMMDKPMGRGYVQLATTADHPWHAGEASAIPIQAHEFHYSTLENVGHDLRFAYRVQRGTGINGEWDGIVYRNVLASYAHLRDTDAYHWTEKFLNFVSAHS